MAWLVLLASAVLEAVWANALSASEGFTHTVPTVVFGVSVVASMAGLAWAMRTIPTGTAYATWTGVGAVLTVIWASATGAEQLTPIKVVLLAGIIACVAGLKASPSPEPAPTSDPDA